MELKSVIPTYFLKFIFDIKAFVIQDTKLKSGISSPFYVNLHKLISYPQFLDELINFCIKNLNLNIKKNSCNHIAGVPYGGIVFASLLSNKLNLSMIMPRKEKKQYGLKKSIEGDYNDNDRIILVEDTITSGSSILNTIELCEQNNLNIELIIIIMDREEDGVNLLKSKGYNVSVLFKCSDIIQYLNANNLIHSKDYTTICQYNKNLLTK